MEKLQQLFIQTANNVQFLNRSVLSISTRGGNLISSFCVVALAAGNADGRPPFLFIFTP